MIKVSKELLPSRPEEKTWNTWNYFALWIGMNVAVATYYVAESYMQLGLSGWQVIISIIVGCLVLVAPMAANGHAGQKYGIPSPVYWRSACGYLGSSATAVIRAAVAVFYFGFHLYIGAQCVNAAVYVCFPAWKTFKFGFAISFALYWALTLFVLTKGHNTMKKLESFTAPFLIIWMFVLLIWARVKAGSWGTLFSAASALKGKDLTNQMLLCLTATIGWWATLVLNITDFTRYAKDNKSHIIGTAVGNPIGFSGLAAVGALVTSCTAIIFGSPIWDPIELTSSLGSPVLVIGMLVFLGLAEITTNTAANAWAPCNDIATVSQGRLNFKQAVWIFGIICLLCQPWKIMSTPSLYVDAFLVCSGAFLAPLAGVNITNYVFINKYKMDINALYDPEGEYSFKRLAKYNKPVGTILAIGGAVLILLGLVLNGEYLAGASSIGVPMRFAYIGLGLIFIIFAFLLLKWHNGGFNPFAFLTIAVSVLCTFIGVYIPSAGIIYSLAWFVATAVSMVLYYFLMKKFDPEFGQTKEVTELDTEKIEAI